MSTGDSGRSRSFDIAVVGAGILGVNIAHWLSTLYNCSIALVDAAPSAAAHTTARNTGVIHRPFYLDPEKKRVFAASAELSYPIWRDLAAQFALPWREVGTLEVARTEEEVRTLEKYKGWGSENGMPDGELELLSGSEAQTIEPEVRCRAAIFSRTDVSVDFGAFTRCVSALASERGVRFLGGCRVESVAEGADGPVLLMGKGGSVDSIRCGFLVNAAGGGAVDLAHMMGVATEYTDLHFRGDYWVVGEPFATRVSRNIYSVARHSQFPFLDPHFVVRADGSRQIGPNAALVAGPFTYEGLGRGILGKLAERPVGPKLRLFTSATFLSLLWTEWRSSVSKGAMCARVRRFLPALDDAFLERRGLSGVRSSVVGKEGFVPEAIQLESGNSLHVLNYNSPGATGAPVFSASVVDRLIRSGALGGLKERSRQDSFWDFDEVLGRLERF